MQFTLSFPPLSASGSIADIPQPLAVSGFIFSAGLPGVSGIWTSSDLLGNYLTTGMKSLPAGRPAWYVYASINGNVVSNSSTGSIITPTTPPAGKTFWLLGWHFTINPIAGTTNLYFRDGSTTNVIAGTAWNGASSEQHNGDYGPYGIPLTPGNSLYISCPQALNGVVWGRFE